MTLVRRVTRHAVRWSVIASVAAAALVALIVVAFAFHARGRHPDLHAWHRLALEEEFHAGRAGAPRTFQEYRALEDRLFAELRRRVLDDPSAADTYAISRYRPGSAPSQLALDTPYNRSFELTPAAPKGAVLLVHGLTDSPYSMRALAQELFDDGYAVVVLRLPGHGTIPAALCDATWQDWYAAVELGVRRAAEIAGPGKPVLAGGYSTGAALVTLYAVRATGDASLPRLQRLFLISPAIGVSKFAVLTNVLSRLSFVPYFEKSKWLDVLPEYDPYKYNSFPVNAANQIYHLTQALRAELAAAKKAGRLDAMPRITAFQSLVDATILASEVIKGLLLLLPGDGNELVVFDVNRSTNFATLVAAGPDADLAVLEKTPSFPFRLTIVANRAANTREIAAFTRAARTTQVQQIDLPVVWPVGVLSLGHVALPFPIDDPVYGLTPADSAGPSFRLGTFPARGEMGATIVPLDTLARLRCNPFFGVVRDKVREALQTTAP